MINLQCTKCQFKFKAENDDVITCPQCHHVMPRDEMEWGHDHEDTKPIRFAESVMAMVGNPR